MAEFLGAALAFPTLVYSVLLLVCVMYWLVAATGLVELDVFDGLDLDHDIQAGGIAAWLGRLGLAGVPLTLVLTLVILVAWIVTCMVHLIVLAPLPGVLRWALGAVTALLALVPAVLVTSTVLRPLRGWLQRLKPPPIASLLGQVAVVRTPRVDARSGMADVDDGGAGLILQVRATADQVYTRGARVVLVAHDAAANSWQVVSEDVYGRVSGTLAAPDSTGESA